ncbi:MAG: nitronate monooxygenase [Rickettsiales bacterium]|nr:nitronate monooxygenase [Rickettsiales bacterium]
MAFNLNSVILSGKEVYPIIEGGKGIGASSGASAGAFAAAGAVGTFSGANAFSYDSQGNISPLVYIGKTRRDRHEELVKNAIEGGIAQAKIAWDICKGKAPIHVNVLWEMGGAQRVLEGILEKTKGLINGITCGAGMPYRLGEIASKYKVYYYPIISSARAFRALWKRAYSKYSELLGGVVYEDPWKAGGHNGLSNKEDPTMPENPYHRVAEIRKFMNEVGLQNIPIIMAGGVWHLKEWENWLNNKEIGKIAFQFGTRPVVTKESPVPEEWKIKLLNLQEGDVFLNRFSPTGFYSSAVKNNFIKELEGRSNRQVSYCNEQPNDTYNKFDIGKARSRIVYVLKEDLQKIKLWETQGFDYPLITPDNTLIFVTKDKAKQIRQDCIDCMGCLSGCKFSNWMDSKNYTTGKLPDPRSFCIQKTLQNIMRKGNVENELMFSGHNAYRFATDPFYKNNFIPTIKQLIDRILLGE